jgi:hypothetical protein
MLWFLRGKVSDRKLRLFACACVRRVLHISESYLCSQCVVVAEEFADGLADRFQMLRARRAATYRVSNKGAHQVYDACRACANPEPDFGSILEASRCVLQAIGEASGFGAAHEQEQQQQCLLLRDLASHYFSGTGIDPLWLAWNGRTVGTLAEAVYNERVLPAGTLDPTRLAVLADALEEAGCTDATLLGHLRSTGPHVRGCWPVDLLLGME